MKKVLLFAGHSRSPFKWGMVGEVVKRLLDDPEIDLYYLDCSSAINTPCGANPAHRWGYCNKCRKNCLLVAKHAGLDENKVLKMEKFKTPKFPDVNSIEELIKFDYEGYNYGLSPASVIMTIIREYDFDIKKWQKKIKEFLKTEYVIFKNLEKLQKEHNFDEIHTFNGRMPSMYPFVSFAKVKDIPYVVYERGGNINKLRVIKNSVPHDFYNLKNDVKRYWENAPENKDEIAKTWFEDRRGGKYQAIHSYTANQIKDSLPANWDETKENIAIFNTSTDEVAAFDSWNHPFAKNENEVLEQVFEHYKDDESKHFYLRIHPNLTKAKKNQTTQIRQINSFRGKYPNLTIIEPDEKLDTYALIDAASKIVVSYSTVGCEAAYWGKPSILAGKSPYEDWDCAYKANSLEELYQLIDTKDLKAKPKENSYPYGYFYQVFGDDYKYFHATTHDEGEIFELKLNKKGIKHVK